jgi:hypothetical protein
MKTNQEKSASVAKFKLEGKPLKHKQLIILCSLIYVPSITK